MTGDKKDRGRFSCGPRAIPDERIRQMVLDRTPVKVMLEDGYLASARIVGWSPLGHRARVEFESGSRFTLDKGRIIILERCDGHDWVDADGSERTSYCEDAEQFVYNHGEGS